MKSLFTVATGTLLAGTQAYEFATVNPGYGMIEARDYPSVEGKYQIGTINSSGANGHFTIGDGNKGLSVQKGKGSGGNY